MERGTLCVLLLAVACVVSVSPHVVVSASVDQAGAPRSLVGTREKVCTWGPSYWCTNITTAKGCGAVKHCIQTVWEHQVLPEDNDDICELCKSMVKQARDQLESNETQEELKEVFEGSCNLIPLKPVAKGCDSLVDEFLPELVETLASQMNPQVVCSVAGLCNNAQIDRMLAAAGKLTKVSLTKDSSSVKVMASREHRSQCKNCTQFMAVMERKFKSMDKDQVLNNMIEECGQLGSYSDACSSLVITHFTDIYGAVKERLFSHRETCEIAQMCPVDAKKTNMNVEVVNESSVGMVAVGEETCDFCKQLVLHLRDILVANTTESEFEQVLRGVCKQMKQFRSECTSIVDQYYGLIYNFLVNNLDGKELCTIVGICPSPGSVKAPIWPLLLAPLPIADHSVDQEKNVFVHISLSSDSASAQASDPASMQLPIERMAPHMLVNVGSNKEACAFCEYFLHYAQTKLADNKNEEKVKHVVETACDHLPKSIGAQCHDFVEQYGNAFIAILIQEIDPSVVCPGLGFCPSKSGSDIVLVGEEKVENKPGCPMCLLAVDQLIAMVKKNNTEENIKAALESLCSHLPKSLKDECDGFVDAYSKQLIEMLLADFTPQEVCVYIKLCDPSKPTHSEIEAEMEPVGGDVFTNEVPQYENTKLVKVKDSPMCVICEFAMSRLETLLKDNATEIEIKHDVLAICSHLPKTVAPQCQKFVERYSDLIITILAQEADPKTVCTMLKLCKPDSLHSHQVSLHFLQENTKKSIEECAVCEGIVQALDTYLQDPKVEDKIDELLERTCLVLPSKQYNKCRNFIQVYGPSIQNIIAQVPGASHLICGKIGVCTKVAGSVDLLGGRKCSWGPGYWCQSKQHAVACGPGPLNHCQERVWKGESP